MTNSIELTAINKSDREYENLRSADFARQSTSASASAASEPGAPAEPITNGAPAEPVAAEAPVASSRVQLLWKLALAGAALTWGFSFFMVKDVVELLPTFQLLAIRFGSSALIMLTLFFKSVRGHLDRRTITVGLAMGVIEWAAFAVQTLGIAQTTAGKNAFLTGTYCVLVPFISYFICGEKLTRYNMGAALLCLSGIALVALDSAEVNVGDLLTLLGAVLFALQISLASKYGRDLDVYAMTFWMFVSMGALSLLTCAAFEDPVPVSEFTPRTVAVLVFLSAVCSCLLMVVQNKGLAVVPASTGSLLLSLESPSGVFFSVIMTGEQLTVRLVTGFCLIFLSIVVSETHLSFLKRKQD